MECEGLSKKELLKKVMEYKFASNDMALFLDTHPCNQRALRLHNEYVEKLNDYQMQYEKEYGPLTIYDNADSWDKWVYETWPWERSEK